jgi:hypothetical protein
MDLEFRWKSTKQPASSGAIAFFGCLFSALAIGLCVAAAVTGVGVDRFLQSAERATGTVVALVEKQDAENKSTTYAPVFAFTTEEGLKQSITSSISGNPAGYSVGERVPIVYRRGEPGGAKLDSFWQLWFLPLFLAAFGLVFGTVGFAFVYTARLKRARENSRLQTP